MTIADTIVELFARRGAAAYHGEAVSQTEHALQSADLAERDGAPDRLVVAALLHDVGHLLGGQDEDLAVRGVDGHHEEAGCAWLAQHFGANYRTNPNASITADPDRSAGSVGVNS